MESRKVKVEVVEIERLAGEESITIQAYDIESFSTIDVVQYYGMPTYEEYNPLLF